MRKIRVKAEQAGASDGDGPDEHTSSAATHRILMLSRSGRVQAAGVYDYGRPRHGPVLGSRRDLPPIDDPSAPPLRELSERMLFFAEALEAVACPDEGVIAGDASVARCWAPASQHGTAACCSASTAIGGLPGVVARARELARQHGERFQPASSLVDRANLGARRIPTHRRWATAGSRRRHRTAPADGQPRS